MPNTFLGFPVVPRLPWDDLYITTVIESVDSWLVVSSPATHVSFDTGRLMLKTDGNPGDYAQARLYKPDVQPPPSWNKERLFRTRCELFALNKSDGLFQIGLAGYATGMMLGFKVQGGKLYAVTSGVGGPTVQELEDFGANGFDVTRSLECRFSPGAAATFYVDSILKATITATLPAGDEDADVFAYLRVDQGPLGPNNLLYTGYWMFWQEA